MYEWLPRWSVNEVNYEDVGTTERIGRNVRDGTVGVIDDLFQGVMSASLVASFTGLLVQKLSIMGGDVVGLIDDNAYTEHVFKGVLSRQFLKFGSSAEGVVGTIGALHEDFSFEGPELGRFAYIGQDTFHTKVYLQPSAILLLGGILASDFAIRPAGHFIMIFGFRETGLKMNRYGIDLIESSANVPFI